METIPPTQDALLQHCRQVAYQAGIWSTSNNAQQLGVTNHKSDPEKDMAGSYKQRKQVVSILCG